MNEHFIITLPGESGKPDMNILYMIYNDRYYYQPQRWSQRVGCYVPGSKIRISKAEYYRMKKESMSHG